MSRDRVAHLHGWPRAEALLHLNVMPPATGGGVVQSPSACRPNCRLPNGVVPWAGDYNRDDVRAVEIPSANGIGTAALGRQGSTAAPLPAMRRSA